MIQLILDAYIEKTKYKLSKYVALALVIIFSILVIVCMVLCYTVDRLFFIGLIVSFLSIIAVVSISCKIDRTKVKQRSIEHNERLDKLKDILLSFTFTNNKDSKNKNNSWYSSNRIKYLVNMCDNFLYRNNHNGDKIFISMKAPIFSVLGFAAAAILEKSTIEEIVIITLVILMSIVLIYLLPWIDNFINFVCIKSNSIKRIADLKLDLLDLLARDFPESLDLEIKIESDN